MSRILADTRKLTYDDWIRMRKNGIGGSDAATVCGMNPYATPYTLWADKTGRLQPKEENEAMRQGHDLEEYVAQRFEERTGKRVRKRNQMFLHDEYDFMLADIDRQVVGERAGLECKTTSAMNLKKFKNGEYPDTHYVQCVHYMAVTGYEKWYLAELVFGKGFFVFEIERDEDEIATLIEAEKEFWESYVVPDVPPPVDGLPATERAINELYQGSIEGSECTLSCKELLQQYLQLKENRKQFDLQLRKVEQQIKQAMGENEIGHCGAYTVNWKRQKRAYISRNKLIETYPKIDLRRVMQASKFRRFSIKGE